MLGKLIGKQNWKWAAFGKHPVAKDYFQINVRSPMATAFASWVDNGFRRLSEDARRETVCSWRFWAQGQSKGAAICGLGKSSSDSIGRPYPMMIVGEGGLNKWEKFWHLMLNGLRQTWETIEYASTRRLRSLEHLETQLSRMPSPYRHWDQTRRSDPLAIADGLRPWHNKIILSDVQEKVTQLELDGRLTVPLDGEASSDPFQTACGWHIAIKNCGAPTPHTVFIGGRPEKNVLALYTRPLAPGDFSELWLE
ncbi:MAG: type VI secretion system-associated protein TagF [Proteobacteria bacterium]|nr:MAG: type VI secretion system-associated protein TagF [Pseudomonadota bacterium]PIE67000.1 MAG: type VI secretion system-associated protein TagF [Deltaproteobacteria bacterium]